MKNRLTGAEAVRDQAPVVTALTQSRARSVKSYQLVNSFATTVSEEELAALKGHPAVAAVIADVLIRRPARAKTVTRAQPAPAAGGVAAGASLTPNILPGACGANGRALLDPEGLQTTHTDSDDPHAATARSLGFTGAGVKVAFIADGIDPQNVNFIRRDGTSAFVDYQDFTGDGPGQATDGGEAFVDSNAIAGQGLKVYDVNGFGAQSYPHACNIRIEGTAPGASLVGLNVYGTFEYTTLSNFAQAVEYAVLVDHVDVLNESFGGQFFPDATSQDFFKQVNDAAVRAGVTVTVASGDAGAANTLEWPASDPGVIAVGATTTFRFLAQTNYAAARYFASAGWLNDNISSFSSGGFDETGAVIDLVAPGEWAFASCDANALYAGCVNFLGQMSTIERSGGTSLSAPLTAGAAALVIEAYRKAHHGVSPTPARVKGILTSTAKDLGVPAAEQGAGLLDSYRAVLLAGSIDAGTGSTAAPGVPTLSFSQNQLTAIALPGTESTWQVQVTNTGAPAQVQAGSRTFGGEENVQSGSVILTDGVSPEFTAFDGLQNNYAVFNFKVPTGTDRLTASLAYPGNPANGNNARVRLILIDPKGRLAAHSVPQGIGNYGSVEVHQPAAGTWSGVIFGDLASLNGTNGTVPWRVATQRFVPFAAVSPASFFLTHGQSQTLAISAMTPSSAGDAAGSVVLTAAGNGAGDGAPPVATSIPVTLRSLVNLADGGDFRGLLTGGNGRPPNQGQIEYFEFAVGAGHRSITANLALTNDSGDQVALYLVNPNGVAVGFGQNNVNGLNSLGVSAFALDPTAGNWTLIVEFAGPVVGDEVSQPYTGRIVLDGIKATAPGLPHDRNVRLAAGVPVTVPVTITNTGAAPEQFFIDARLDGSVSLAVPLLYPPSAAPPFGCGTPAFTLPLGSTCGDVPTWLVPTQTSSIQVGASATLPVEFDFSAYPGDPDILGVPTGPTTAAGSYTPGGGRVEQGLWGASPSEIGPYQGPASTGSVAMSMTINTRAFDPAVTTAQGDLWLGAVSGLSVFDTFAPLTLNPGDTGIILVTITPDGPPGTVVSGKLYVNDYVGYVAPYGQTSGDELAAIPYAYTIR